MAKVLLTRSFENIPDDAPTCTISRVPVAGEHIQHFADTYLVVAVIHMADPPSFDAMVKIKPLSG